MVAKYIKRELNRGNSSYYVYHGYENYPVVYISWEGANAYISWLNEQTQLFYRLPTQNEWENVARLGVIGVVHGSLSFVGSKEANILGLYDIFGNVAEWGEDDFGEFSKVILGGSYSTFRETLSSTMYMGMNKQSHKNSDIGFRVVR